LTHASLGIMGLEHEVHTGSCRGLDMGFEDQHTNLCLP